MRCWGLWGSRTPGMTAIRSRARWAILKAKSSISKTFGGHLRHVLFTIPNRESRGHHVGIVDSFHLERYVFQGEIKRHLFTTCLFDNHMYLCPMHFVFLPGLFLYFYLCLYFLYFIFIYGWYLYLCLWPCLVHVVFVHPCIKSLVDQVQHLKELKRAAGPRKVVEPVNLGKEEVQENKI